MVEKFNPEKIITDFSKEEIILGIDEAGRGPVMGPMIYACAYWSNKNNDNICKYFKFDDSKKLKTETREKIYDEILKYPNLIRFEIIEISPKELSTKMLQRKKTSLNQISHNAAGSLISAAKSKGANIKAVYVDTVGTPEYYKEFLEKKIQDSEIKVVVEPKADAKYGCVSAASIIAKVTRDHHIIDWVFKEKDINDRKFGSGYTSDPYTVKWLKRNYNSVFGYPDFIRFSWKTIKSLFKENGDQCEWEGYKEEDDDYYIYHKKKEQMENQPQISFESQKKKKNVYDNIDVSVEVDL